MSKTTIQMRLYPTPEQAGLLMAHRTEYISTVNVLASALDADLLPDSVSTRGFAARLPSVVKNQALRDAQSVFKRSLTLSKLPVLKKPICQWNNQNWHLTNDTLPLPMYVEGTIQQVAIKCCGLVYAGKAGILRIKKKRSRSIQPAPARNVLLAAPEARRRTGPMSAQCAAGMDMGTR